MAPAARLRARARPAMAARSMTDVAGRMTPSPRSAATTPVTIGGPRSVAQAARAAASIISGRSALVGARSPSAEASRRAWSVIVCGRRA